MLDDECLLHLIMFYYLYISLDKECETIDLNREAGEAELAANPSLDLLIERRLRGRLILGLPIGCGSLQSSAHMRSLDHISVLWLYKLRKSFALCPSLRDSQYVKGYGNFIIKKC